MASTDIKKQATISSKKAIIVYLQTVLIVSLWRLFEKDIPSGFPDDLARFYTIMLRVGLTH